MDRLSLQVFSKSFFLHNFFCVTHGMFDKLECVTILGSASVVCSTSDSSEPMSCNGANLLLKSSSNSVFKCSKESLQ